MSDVPTQGLTDRQLKFSYWYVTNKLKLRKYLVAFLVALCLAFFVYVGWQLALFVVDYQAQDYNIKRMLFGGNPGLSSVEALQPVPIEVSPVRGFNVEGGRYDFMSQVRNSNANWLVTFDYQFISDRDRTVKRKGFIMPGESKYLMDLGIEDTSVSLEISNQKWIRIDNYSAIYDEKYYFTTENEEFIAGQEPGDPNILAFDITNRSAYSYWEFPVQAFLYNAGTIRSINYITLEQFKAGETRRVELFWNTKLSRIDGYNIIPDINILDETNIMPPEGEIYLR